MPRSLRPAAVLSAITLLVWTTRIRNIWIDDSLDTAGQLGRTALALSFTVLAVGVVVVALRRPTAAPAWVSALAGWTVAVWVVRGAQIALGDHSVGFILVHVVLAVVSIGLAVWAQVRARPAEPSRSERVSVQRP